MKRALALVALFVLTSGCLTQRSATFSTPPGPLPFSTELQPKPLERSWALGEIFVKAAIVNGQQAAAAEDWSQARSQIEERLAQTIRRQPALGQRVEERKSAELVVDVTVELHETRAVNGWIGGAIAAETAILLAGMGTGAAIGSATVPQGKEMAALNGSLIGLGISIVPAILVPLAFPMADHLSSADAKLTFRRASDGVVVYEKQTRAQRFERVSAYGVEQKTSRITGSLAESLEKEIVTALYAGLRASPSGGALAEDRPSGPAFFAPDAPTRLSLTPPRRTTNEWKSEEKTLLPLLTSMFDWYEESGVWPRRL